ncbi:MAG: sulfite exporter TauE/SafE family protein [Actinomycetota bacterium]
MLGVGQFLLVAVVGVVTGILSGIFGVGGAVVTTPAVRALGAPPLDAVGSTIPSIIPSAISGTIRYMREGLIRWPVFGWTSAFGISAAVGGALLTEFVPGDGHPLMLATAALLAFTSFRLALPRPTAASITDPDATATATPVPHLVDRATPARAAAVGLAAGGLSGLLGIGGGILMVPAFTTWMRLPLKAAVATSLACVGVLAIPSMITHAALGHIDWSYAIPLSIGVIPGARIGANLAIRSTERTLRISVATVLGLIAILYFVGELASLLS